MKRTFSGVMFVLALILSLSILPVVATAGNPWTDNAVLTVTVGGADNVTSAAVLLPKNVSRLTVYVPTLTSSTVFLLASIDGGTTYGPWYSFNNGTNVIQTTTAAATGVYVWDVPGNFHNVTHIKVKCGTAQAATRQFKVAGTVDQVHQIQ